MGAVDLDKEKNTSERTLWGAKKVNGQVCEKEQNVTQKVMTGRIWLEIAKCLLITGRSSFRLVWELMTGV